MRRLLLTALALALFATACVSETQISTMPEPAAPVEPSPTPLTLEPGEEVKLERIITGSYRKADCAPELTSELAVMPECGWLTRPLHGSRGDDVELPVMLFRATGAAPEPDPILYLHGGPTGGILSEVGWVFDLVVEPYLGERDVILFDQRGTGFAKPDLGCDSPYQWFSARDEDPFTYVGRTARTCTHTLRSDGIDPEQFTRQRSADDVMVLARELGYEQFNIHGSSWGGILGYTVMQLHPTLVRSAVLDSPLSVSTDISGSMPASFLEAFEAMQANCDLDPACAARHGNIVDRYVRVFDQLDANPLNVTLSGLWTVELNGDELAYILFGLFYSPRAIAVIPEMLLELENGNIRLAEELANVYGWGWGIDFTFLTYMCTDIVSISSQEAVADQELGIAAFDRVDDAPDGRGHTAKPICERMRIEAPLFAAVEEEIPTTPTLVFSGSMDPITAYSSGRELAATLPNAGFVGINDLSHGITFDECGQQIARDFFAAPDGDLDTSCSFDENRPPFVFGTDLNYD